jgi:hypothetical protein
LLKDLIMYLKDMFARWKLLMDGGDVSPAAHINCSTSWMGDTLSTVSGSLPDGTKIMYTFSVLPVTASMKGTVQVTRAGWSISMGEIMSTTYWHSVARQQDSPTQRESF